MKIKTQPKDSLIFKLNFHSELLTNELNGTGYQCYNYHMGSNLKVFLIIIACLHFIKYTYDKCYKFIQ